MGYEGPLLVLAVAIGGAMAGFLPWNWHPSKIVLGDLGAIPAGFLIGFLLIHLALKGQLAGAIILPLYFLVDASLTLSRRDLRGAQFWKPHREHFYQRALASGVAHSHIVRLVAVTNLVLAMAAVLSLYFVVPALVLAVFAVTLLLAYLQYLSQR